MHQGKFTSYFLSTSVLLSSSVTLPTLDTSVKWNDREYLPSYFIQHKVFKTFIQVVAWTTTSFLHKAGWYSIVHTYLMLVIHVSVGEHSGCFCSLVTNIATYGGAYCLLESLLTVLLGMYLGVAMLYQVVILFELNTEGWEWLSRRKQNTYGWMPREGTLWWGDPLIIQSLARPPLKSHTVCPSLMTTA